MFSAKFVRAVRQGIFIRMRKPPIEQRGEFAHVPRENRSAHTLPGIEAHILQSLARGQDAVVSRSVVANALDIDTETDDTAVTGWAERLARQHQVRWTRPSLREILFALHDRK